ncbi:hypothetical protein AADP96_07670, partial [Escherichia coli]
MWISSKVSRAKAPKNGRLPKKAAIIHKIPEFVGGTADFRRRSFSFERKRKKKIIFLPLFIIYDNVNALLVLFLFHMIFLS